MYGLNKHGYAYYTRILHDILLFNLFTLLCICLLLGSLLFRDLDSIKEPDSRLETVIYQAFRGLVIDIGHLKLHRGIISAAAHYAHDVTEDQALRVQLKICVMVRTLKR